MARRERLPFRMKRFSISDSRSANKIGVDGVLTGSWAPVAPDVRRILDVGCGCGVITLMMAQRASNAEVTGIDIEPNAVEEALLNAAESPFADRIRILESTFEAFVESVKAGHEKPVDIIVSNPPFFESGVDPSESERMLARHSGSLSPFALIAQSGECLSSGGRLSFIGPAEYLDDYTSSAINAGWGIERVCLVKGNPGAKAKRVMMALRKPSEEYSETERVISEIPEPEILVIETSPGQYTDEYIRLGSPFYLKF